MNPTSPDGPEHLPDNTGRRPAMGRQFLELVIACVGLLAVHVASFMLAGKSLISPGYFYWGCIALPFFSLLMSVMLVVKKRWHWGLGVFFMIFALGCGALQLMICGIAYAAV
jgi:glucan phosphoethanolaminetransferase (alkaline phosphatase superfamily)